MLKNKALIVGLSVSQWTGRKLDKRATETVSQAHKTDGRAGNYTKKLLPGAKELEEIARVTNEIRAFYYRETLPWMADGSRILASSNYLPFTSEFRKRKDQFQAAVESFLAVYPSLKESARASLGDLFNERDYPSVAKLRECFACEASFLPVPDAGDFRVEILDSEKEALTQSIRKAEAAAMRDCWERLHGVVKTAASKLATPGAIFRDSLIENITELCGLLPRLNYQDDPALEAMRREVETLVSKVNPDTLRNHAGSRDEAAKALDSISEKMAAFMGCEIETKSPETVPSVKNAEMAA